MTKILLVEDDKSLREIYGVRLLAEGYDIVSAGDGEEALAMAIKERPTLIISDVMMPKISGFDMLDILRSTTETKTIKVIMMTALSSEEQRVRGESLGADKYLVKSQVGIEDVVRVVHEVLDDAPTASAVGGSSDYAAPAAPAPEPAPEAIPEPPVADTVPVAPVPEPIAPAAPVAAEPLPEPTSAYETPRPASAGERIIQPLPTDQNPTTPPDINALLDKELAAEVEPTPIPAPADPSPYALPTDPAAPATGYGISPELQGQIAPAAPSADLPTDPAQAPLNGVSSNDEPTPPAGPQAA